MIGSWFISFGDAPEASRRTERIPGVTCANTGTKISFRTRAGYFYETKTGNRRTFTTGLGLKYNIFGFNFAYLSPLEMV